MSLQPYYIEGYQNGLQQDRKPFLLLDTAFPRLENAYVWRERLKKREGLQLVGRLRRLLTAQSLGNTVGAQTTYTFTNIFSQASITGVSGQITGATNAANCQITTLVNHGLTTGQEVTITGVGGMTELNGNTYTITVTGLNTFTIGVNSLAFGVYTTGGIWTTQPNKEIEPGSLIITIAAPDAATFTDNGDGTFTVTGVGVSSGSWVNYATGVVQIVLSAAVGGAAITFNINYFPGLPVMGIIQREISNINNEQTIFFDTTYAYQYVSQSFQELVAGTIWTGNDSDFFWGANYRGSTADSRLFFVTNFNIDDPIRYFNGAVWTDFSPYVSRATPPDPNVDQKLYQARILIPYYGRLLALNTYEGTETGGSSSASNFFNRCRFSQVGSPIEADAWRSDQFGRGGFIDAPVNEEIISAIFYKNTLIVFFEKTTWQLRYVGEYGLPFIWERISSDFGSESTFSPVLFDEGVLGVGDRGIITSSGVNVQRIDESIPDIVFSFRNTDNGHKRVHGIRDFRKELVYWCFPASQQDLKFPNYSLVYNYRNNTFSIFRNNVTAFGKLASPSGISWDSQDVTWDMDIRWDTFIQEEYLDTVSGNQQGYIHFYGEPSSETISDSNVSAFDQESLSITGVDLTTTPIQLTVINHNLESTSPPPQGGSYEGDVIYITGLNFINTTDSSVFSTNLNNQIYGIERIDDDTIGIIKWNFTSNQYEDNFSFTPVTTATYAGGGEISLFPRLNVMTKDFNPFSKQGIQCKLAYVDFLTDATTNASFTVNLYSNNSLDSQSNVLIGQKQSETSLNPSGLISDITQANPAVITTFSPHGLLDGYSVQISSVEGMTNINGLISKVTVIDSTSYELDTIDSSAFSSYTRGGNWTVNSYPFYVKGSNYTWHRFYAGSTGNFFSLGFTYDDALMNTLITHQQDWVMNAMQLWVRQGGKGIF